MNAKLDNVVSFEIAILASYIDQAMEIALYEIIEDDDTYWGEIPGLQGVWANHVARNHKKILSDRPSISDITLSSSIVATSARNS